MKIKHKLRLVGLFVFINIVCLMLGSQYALKYTSDAQHISQQLEKVEKDFFMLEKNGQMFLLSNNMEYTNRFSKGHSQTSNKLRQFIEELSEFGIDSNIGMELQSQLKQYNDQFEVLVNTQQKIGLNPTSGFYGAMRDAVHQVEDVIKSYKNDLLLSRMLELRRNEKDFMLRHDAQYIKRFENNIALFHSDLSNSLLSAEAKLKIQEKIKAYENNFYSLLSSMEAKGLEVDQGLQGKLQNTANSVTMTLEKLAEATHKTVKTKIEQNNIAIQIASIISIILAQFSLYWITRQVTSSLDGLANLIEKSAKTFDLSLRHPAKRKDEIGKTGRAFNKMMEQFQLIIKEVNTAANDLYSSTKQLSESAKESNSSIQTQQQQTDQLSIAMDDMTQSVNSIANSARDCANTAIVSRDHCSTGHTVVQTAADSIQLLSEKIDNANNAIQRLQKDSDSIGSVLDVIRDIAEQTNLLALNAAIEAARAGEQGRGFAVVADEVRTLAGRTQESTTEIQEIIESLQGLSNEAAKATAESLEQTKISVDNILSTGETLSEIIKDVSNITDMNEQIATVTEQQKTVTLEVCESAKVIKTEAAHGVEQSYVTAESSHHLATLAKQLHSLSAKFKI